MAYKIKFSKQAERDLDELFEYIHKTLVAPKASLDMIADIEKKVCLLAKKPLMCPKCQSNPLCELGYRKLVIKNYVVIYSVNEKEKFLYIVRIFYGRRDYVKYI